MKTNSKEFYEMQENFEKNIKNDIYGHTIKREDNELRKKRIFYTDGYVNTLFLSYMYGYTYRELLNNLESA